MRRPAVSAFALSFLLVLPLTELPAGPATLTFTLDGSNFVTPSLGSADVSGGAGTDFASTWQSATNAALLEVKHSSGTGWNITVYKVDSAGWASTTLTLEVQRTGAGTGGATLQDGLSYQFITDTDTYFFRGVGGDRKNIPLQYRIGNISVELGVGTFTTTVYYTVTEY